MTTKLSERLRELRERIRRESEECEPCYPSAISTLDLCIAQAEAMEALPTDAEMDRALETMPDYNKRLAQAGELSDDRMWEMVDAMIAERWPDTKELFTYTRQHLFHVLKIGRDKGYLRPSQAIGEQTPVAMTDNEILQFARKDKHGFELSLMLRGDVLLGDFQRNVIGLLRSFPLYRSPMSSEARDMAIE